MFHLLLLGEKDGRVKKEKGIVCPAVQLNPGNDIVAIVFEIKKQMIHMIAGELWHCGQEKCECIKGKYQKEGMTNARMSTILLLSQDD